MNTREYADRLMLQLMPFYVQLFITKEENKIVADGTPQGSLNINTNAAQVHCFNACVNMANLRDQLWVNYEAEVRRLEKEKREQETRERRAKHKDGNGESKTEANDDVPMIMPPFANTFKGEN